MSRRFVSAVAVVAATFAGGGFLAGRVASDEPPPGMTPEMAEMMKEWERLKKPGAEHELLKGLAGNWVGTGTWTEEGMTMGFTEEVSSKLAFGGRFIQSEAKMTIAAQGPMPAFTGTSLMLFGYDNAKQKYVHSMVSDMSTAIGSAEGTFDAATKTFTMLGVEDLGNGKERKYRVLQKIVSPDEWTFEMYFTPAGGTESKAGVAVYKRKAAPVAVPAVTVSRPASAPARGCCPTPAPSSGPIGHVRPRP